MPAALSVDLRRRVVAALEQGLSCSQVAERFGVNPASASRWRARLGTYGSVAEAPMGGVVAPPISRSTLLFCSTTSHRSPT